MLDTHYFEVTHRAKPHMMVKSIQTKNWNLSHFYPSIWNQLHSKHKKICSAIEQQQTSEGT